MSESSTPQTNPPEILARQLGKEYAARQGTTSALTEVNLTIQKGQFCCIVGPSGCGKTTLLRIIDPSMAN